MTDTPQVFDHDPRIPQGAKRARKSTFHTDPPMGTQRIEGTNGFRNHARLSMGETLRQKERENGIDPTDPEIIKAKALVEAVGAITKVGAQQARLERHSGRRADREQEVYDSLVQGAEARKAQQEFRGRAAAERAIQAAGAEPTAKLMALFGYGPNEGPTPTGLQTGRRFGQEPLKAAGPSGPQGDSLAQAVMRELADERAAQAVSDQLDPSQITDAQVAAAMATLERAGIEVLEPVVVEDPEDSEVLEAPEAPEVLEAQATLGDPEE